MQVQWGMPVFLWPLGFEAVPRPDLPPGTRRHPYALDDKSRAIVVLQRT